MAGFVSWRADCVIGNQAISAGQLESIREGRTRRFRSVLFGHSIRPMSPLEHGCNYFFLLPVSQRLVVLEPRRGVAVRFCGWTSPPDYVPPIWSPRPLAGMDAIRLDTVPLSSLPSLAVLRRRSTPFNLCSRSPFRLLVRPLAPFAWSPAVLP